MNKYSQYSKNFDLRKRIHGGGCAFKKAFSEQSHAEGFMQRRGLVQTPYKCHFCPYWHLKSKRMNKGV